MSYLDHFRLHSAPFTAAPDAALFHAQGAHSEILGALAYAVTHGDGIVKITGEAGSGMTMLCHALARQLAGQAIIIHMEPASLGPLGVIHPTSIALGLDPDGKRSDEVLRLMQSQLSAMRAGGRHAVLVADHADMLPPEALEEIRLLTNLADEHGSLMHIVLLGQPALNASLRQPAMRQIRERITLSFVMPALTADEVPALLAHRLRAAGYDGLDMFAADAARLLASHAKGDLRKLIRFAHLSLEAAASEGAVSVTARHAQAAVRGRLPAWRPRGLRPAIAGAAAAVAVIGIGAAAVLAPRSPASVPAMPKSTPITTRMTSPASAQDSTMAAMDGSVSGASPRTTPVAPLAPASALASAPAPAQPAVNAANAATMMAAGAAVGDTAAPAPPQPGAPSGLLQQTLKATQSWLRDEPDSHVSIKIEDFPATDQARIEAFLVEVRGAIGLRDVHAYPTFNNGAHRIGIAYGSYSSEQQAAKAMATLKGRWRYLPKTRTIGAIRAASARASKHAEK